MIKPRLPSYPMNDWRAAPMAERIKMVCQSWAVQGYGSPPAIYLVYLLKIAFYIYGWAFFCSFTPGLGDMSSFSEWWFQPIAFQKAVLWTVAFEILGLGCGSGPLTGRYLPPIGGFLYWLRPGTIKLPLFPGVPFIGRQQRGLTDIILYVLFLGLLFSALVRPDPLAGMGALPMVILLLMLGVFDKTLFLAARSDHYLAVLVCFLFPEDWLAGSKFVWLAVWYGAATSKLNRHFGSVVAVMISNSPVMSMFPWFRRAMYRSYPEDLRPSKLATTMAHTGTVTEYAFPTILALGSGSVLLGFGSVEMASGSMLGGLGLTGLGLIIMFGFHTFITSCVPMGVPLEWNVIMVYGAFYLFGYYADVSILSINSDMLAVSLAVLVGLVPMLGNLYPRFISFLMSMRYYAGNWACSVWLFEPAALSKLNRLKKSSPLTGDQLGRLYDDDTVTAIMSKVTAFRSMHMHGRFLQMLVPRAVDNVEEREWLDGEIVAGLAIGWNFGEGHLHNMQLLEAIQQQCGFESGELRCVMLESQPMLDPRQEYTIADAADGVIERGNVYVDQVIDEQPWSLWPKK